MLALLCSVMRVSDSPVHQNEQIFFSSHLVHLMNKMNKSFFKSFGSFNERKNKCEVHYMEKNAGMFSSKTLISF